MNQEQSEQQIGFRPQTGAPPRNFLNRLHFASTAPAVLVLLALTLFVCIALFLFVRGVQH
jgi:hypothetical protein